MVVVIAMLKKVLKKRKNLYIIKYPIFVSSNGLHTVIDGIQ